MRDWETKRSNEISENIMVTHIVSLLLFFMILVSFFNYAPAFYSHFYLAVISEIAFCIIAAVYVARKLLAKYTFMDQPRIDEILLLAITLPGTFAFLWYSNGFLAAKMLLIVPAIITAIAFGQTVGVVEAMLSCGLLFLMDYLLHGGVPAEAFQANLIVTGVATLMAWLVGGLIVVERDTQRELLKLADYDTLTGLINYRYLQEKLAVSLRETAAGASPLSLALLDVNQLNYYNHVYGYQKGDEILEVCGRLLQEQAREPCYAARYGDDEFMLVLPGQDQPAARSTVGGIAARLVRQATALLLEDHSADTWKDFTIATGLACSPDDGEAVLPLIRAAEEDLTRHKYSKTDYMYQSIISDISTLPMRESFPTLHTFIALINAKDQYTFGHAERVIAYALSLGERLRLSEYELDLLRFAAYLHDIGKIEIDQAILTKTGDLDSEEWAIMKSHPLRGSELLKPITSYLPLVPAIRSHHENWDGSGYPDGLRGVDISLMGRILRIADSFDVMTTSRPYRAAMSMEEACAELRAHAGTWYDPEFVYMFLDIVKVSTSLPAEHGVEAGGQKKKKKKIPARTQTLTMSRPNPVQLRSRSTHRLRPEKRGGHCRLGTAGALCIW